MKVRGGEVVDPASGGKLGGSLGEVKGEVHMLRESIAERIGYKGEGRKELFQRVARWICQGNAVGLLYWCCHPA